jgi:hypothetical protein
MDDISQRPDEHDALPVTPPEPPAPLPTPTWVIPRLLGTGLTILSGDRWSGKSWLALDLALAVATGGRALQSIACEAGDVIYFDMDNGKSRLAARMDVLLEGRKADPSRIRFSSNPPPETDLVTTLTGWVAEVDGPRLVVIDAAQRIGPIAGGRLARRELREEELSRLQGWAHEEEIAVLVVVRPQHGNVAHCERIMGIADATLELARKAGVPVLTIKGRDAPRRKMTLAFDGERWAVVDDGDNTRNAFLRTDILSVLKSSAWSMSPRDVAAELGITKQNARQALSRLARDGEIVRDKPGTYLLPNPYVDSPDWTSPDGLPPELERQWFEELDGERKWREAGGPSHGQVMDKSRISHVKSR